MEDKTNGSRINPLLYILDTYYTSLIFNYHTAETRHFSIEKREHWFILQNYVTTNLKIYEWSNSFKKIKYGVACLKIQVRRNCFKRVNIP